MAFSFAHPAKNFMAHISGTFSNAAAGRLRVTLIGSYFETNQRDAGFPAGASNYSLRGIIAGNNMEPIDRYAPVSYMELDYPGGGASWAVSTATVATSSGSITTFGLKNLKMIVQLVKK